MNQRELGNSGLFVSEISLGCWTMGGLNWVDGSPNGWANVDEDEVTLAIKTAIDQGVNHFDNADVYGNGTAERMLARVLDRLGVPTNDLVIATKLGHFKGTAAHAYEPAHIRHQCEQSLVNLKRDYIDLYYFHHGNFGASDMYLDDAAAEMDRLVEQGKVRVKGQSAYSNDDFVRVTSRVRPSALQSWAHAMDTRFVAPGTPVANLMASGNMSFVAFSPLAQGLLLNKYSASNPPSFEAGDHRANAEKFTTHGLESIQEKMNAYTGRFGSSVAELAPVALRYLLDHDNVACVIPGFRNLNQVQLNLAGKDRVLTQEDRDFIKSTLEPSA
jgi:aryl-alcohol dehydrogenase-like predicted oxidoreductase